MAIQVDAVIFDYGNTILHDPFETIIKSKVSDFQEILEKAGCRISKEKIIKSWNKSNKAINYPHITHFAQEEPIIQDCLKDLGVNKKDITTLSHGLLMCYRANLRKFISQYPLKNKIKETLNVLKKRKKKLAVLSNGRKFDVSNAIKWLGLSNYFDLIISSDETGVEKSNPKFFILALEKLGEPASKTVYVGDDPIRDIQPAKDLGMKAILYQPPRKYRKSMPWRKYNIKIKNQPDATIKNLAELTKLII
jgi:putative hydrolase of the HAD superfamily